jgi:hypothetical protein
MPSPSSASSPTEAATPTQVPVRLTAPREPVLEVTSGLHNGVQVALAPRRYRIGSGAGVDIVLRDAGVAPDHAAIRVDRGHARLEAANGDIRLGSRTLPKGHGCVLRLPVHFALGDVALRIVMPGRPDRPRGAGAAALHWLAQRRHGLIGITVALSAAGLVVAAWPTSGKPPTAQVAADPRINVAALGDLNKLGLGLQGKADEVEPPRLDDVVRALGLRLATVDLAALKVTVAGDRPIVTGTVSKGSAEAWTSVQQWFDQTYGRSFTLGANVTVGDARASPAVRLQAVWFGPRPYVIAVNGARYYQDAVLDGGWVIREIGEDRVLLARNGESLAIPTH